MIELYVTFSKKKKTKLNETFNILLKYWQINQQYVWKIRNNFMEIHDTCGINENLSERSPSYTIM